MILSPLSADLKILHSFSGFFSLKDDGSPPLPLPNPIIFSKNNLYEIEQFFLASKLTGFFWVKEKRSPAPPPLES